MNKVTYIGASKENPELHELQIESRMTRKNQMGLLEIESKKLIGSKEQIIATLEGFVAQNNRAVQALQENSAEVQAEIDKIEK
jgi:hypothetical protein